MRCLFLSKFWGVVSNQNLLKKGHFYYVTARKIAKTRRTTKCQKER